MDMRRVLLSSFLCISTAGGVNAGPKHGRPILPPAPYSQIRTGTSEFNDLTITQPESVSDEVWKKVVYGLRDLINERLIQVLILLPDSDLKYYEIRLRVLPDRISPINMLNYSSDFYVGYRVILREPQWSVSVNNGVSLTNEMPIVELEEDLDNKKLYIVPKEVSIAPLVLSCLRESNFILKGDNPSLIEKKLFHLVLRQFIMRRYFPEYCERPTGDSPEGYESIREQYLDAVDYFIENGNLVYAVCTSQIQLNLRDMSPNIKLPASK